MVPPCCARADAVFLQVVPSCGQRGHALVPAVCDIQRVACAAGPAIPLVVPRAMAPLGRTD